MDKWPNHALDGHVVYLPVCGDDFDSCCTASNRTAPKCEGWLRHCNSCTKFCCCVKAKGRSVVTRAYAKSCEDDEVTSSVLHVSASKPALFTTKHEENLQKHLNLPEVQRIQSNYHFNNFIGYRSVFAASKIKDDGHGTCQATTLLLWLPPEAATQHDNIRLQISEYFWKHFKEILIPMIFCIEIHTHVIFTYSICSSLPHH